MLGIVFWRLALAALVFLPLVRVVAVRTVVALVAIGGVQFGLMSLAYTASFRYLSSHQVALLTVVTPLYVVLLCDLFRRRVRPRYWLAAAISILGAAVILFPYGESLATSFATSLTGFLLVEAANITFALGQVCYRRVASWERLAGPLGEPLGDASLFFWLYAGGVMVSGIAAVVAGELTGHHSSDLGCIAALTATQLGAIVYLGVIASGVSFFLWNSGARRVADGTLAVMNNVKIPLAVVASILLFGERPALVPLLCGSAIIIAALFVASFKSEGEEVFGRGDEECVTEDRRRGVDRCAERDGM